MIPETAHMSPSGMLALCQHSTLRPNRSLLRQGPGHHDVHKPTNSQTNLSCGHLLRHHLSSRPGTCPGSASKERSKHGPGIRIIMLTVASMCVLAHLTDITSQAAGGDPPRWAPPGDPGVPPHVHPARAQLAAQTGERREFSQRHDDAQLSYTRTWSKLVPLQCMGRTWWCVSSRGWGMLLVAGGASLRQVKHSDLVGWEREGRVSDKSPHPPIKPAGACQQRAAGRPAVCDQGGCPAGPWARGWLFVGG